MSPRDRFLEKLRASFDDGTFVKLTLSQPARPSDLRNFYVREIELRKGRRLSCVWRYATRDVTKNLSPAEAISKMGEMLGTEFARAHLFTISGDWQLRCDVEDGDRLIAARPAFAQIPSPEHDRRKIKPARRKFLEALGVTKSDGAPRAGMADKLRQIDRFTELLGHLIDDSPLRDRREVRVVDMGAGKGYLTFATCEFFRARGVTAEVIGIERRPDLVELTNNVAKNCGTNGVRFIEGAIGETPIGECDVLIALHACDIATDDALHEGLRAGASLLVTSPCCHKEVRPQLQPPPVLRDVLKHGILLEREAEIITDALRALLLEIHGYKANVFEFISPEHTSRNLMIAAHRRTRPLDPEPLRTRMRELLDFYGIREQRLARLLGEL
jgi:SAM-dependent methyltransferase